MEKFTHFIDNPLLILSDWKSDENNCLKHQIGFLSEYLLDNICKKILFRITKIVYNLFMSVT